MSLAFWFSAVAGAVTVAVLSTTATSLAEIMAMVLGGCTAIGLFGTVDIYKRKS